MKTTRILLWQTPVSAPWQRWIASQPLAARVGLAMLTFALAWTAGMVLRHDLPLTNHLTGMIGGALGVGAVVAWADRTSR